MKSFSATSFATDETDHLEQAKQLVSKDPQALFTNFQWFLYKGNDTVFYTAFTTKTFDKDGIGGLVAEMVLLAPQLTHGFVGANPGQPFPQHILDSITSVEYVDSLDGYPDKWISKSADIYDDVELPLFRVMVVQLKNGPDSEGRHGLVQVRASHAVMEGSDSALLTRSANSSHGIMSDSENKVSLWSRVKGNARAWTMTGLYLTAALILAPPAKPTGFKTLAISRHRLRDLANKIGVRQRSLYFALVTYALNGEGANKNLAKKVIGAAYTMLDNERHSGDDDFFRVRALEAKFKVNEDFSTFVKDVDETIGKIEQKDVRQFQMVVNAMFRTIRALNRVLPGLPPKKFWRFNGNTQMVLTLVPPHRTYGRLTDGVVEPIFCGAWHDGINICTFCPSRNYLALSFAMDDRLLKYVDDIEPLIVRIEAEYAGSSMSVSDA